MANTKRRIDYQKTLREVAKSMVRLKRPERLLKMITRFIDREVGLAHTSLLVLEEKRKRFIFVDSKGSRRFPIGLVKIDIDHPLVTWFRKQNGKIFSKQDYLYRPHLERTGTKEAQGLLKSMDNFKIELIIPGYYKETLIGLLLLGEKLSGLPFRDSEISFFQILAQDCSMAVKTAEYHRNLIAQNQELASRLAEIEGLRKKEHETYYQIMRSLAQEVHVKDAYTFGHVNQVERLGMMTARAMGLDLSGRRADILSAGLILHDVGKIGIPDAILKKQGPLTEEEWNVMRTHVDKGAKILEPLSDFREVAEIVRCHHENFDGSGYPRGLAGSEIPMESRIVSVVDSFHAIVSTRCYSQGRSIEFACEELKRCAGKQFDPRVVEAFIQALKKEMKKRGVGFFLDNATNGSRGVHE